MALFDTKHSWTEQRDDALNDGLKKATLRRVDEAATMNAGQLNHHEGMVGQDGKHSSTACTVSLEHWEMNTAVAAVHEELTRQLLHLENLS